VGRLWRHLRHPRPGSIVATLALFLAAGGGALAFSGSGTLQKENEIGIEAGPGDPKQVIRTVAGTGTVEASCGAGIVTVGTRNRSGKLQLRARTVGNAFDVGGPDPHFTGRFENYTQDKLVEFHLSPGDGSKAPQASITVSIDYTDNCATTQVAVINVTTVG
jgi:hypothetical protein